MSSLITPQNIMFVVAIISVIFSVYLYFRNPQIQSEKEDIVSENRITNLAKDVATLAASFQSHILADQASFSQLNQHVVEVDKSVVKLTTIIDERIPKKE